MLRLLTMILSLFFAGPALADGVDAALATCWSCHGAGAPPKDPAIPVIQGQHAAYLEKQLRDFRGGERDDQIMSSMATSIRREDLARAAATIAALPWPKSPGAAPAPEPDSVAACRACHGPGFAGGPGPEGVAPRLAGQSSEYLEAQMSAFARGERANAKTMTVVMKALDAAERARLAKYLAGL